MTTLPPLPMPVAKSDPTPVYEAPAIVYRAQLKHFSGSPLATDPNAPDNLLGLPR